MWGKSNFNNFGILHDMKKIITIILLLTAGIIGYYHFADKNTSQTNEDIHVLEDAYINKEGSAVLVFEKEEKIIAPSITLRGNNFDEVRRFESAHISPNKKFVIFEAIGFKESFLYVYDFDKNILHERIYGENPSWNPNNTLQITLCDFVRERCTDMTSLNSETPWILVKSGLEDASSKRN